MVNRVMLGNNKALLPSLVLGVSGVLSTALILWWLSRVGVLAVGGGIWILAVFAAIGVAASVVAALYLFTVKTRNETIQIAVDMRTRELREAQERADHARIEAEVANKAKSVFLATMSHELRTPLTGVLGYIDLMRQKITDPQYKDMIEKLNQAALAQRAIVNDVLDYSRISAGKIEIEKVPFRLQDVIDAAVATYGNEAKEKDVFVGIQMQEGVPKAFVGDPSRLQQVLNNLMSNAVKFTDKGSVTLHVAGKYIDIDNFQLQLTVHDTGIGISADKQETLFEPFSQSDTTMTRRFSGTGIGLAICREVVDAMGGSLDVESKLDWGSRFTIEVEMPVIEMQKTAERIDYQKILFGGVPLRILIVEDYDLVREMLATNLTQAGHVVMAVSNGAEAYETVYSPVAENYDLILMDLHMPIMDGAETATRIRALEGRSGKTPIIGFSADMIPEHVERFRRSGINAYINKPIDWNELGRVMHDVMEASHEQAVHEGWSSTILPGGRQPVLIVNIFSDFVEPLDAEQTRSLYDATISFFVDCEEKLEVLTKAPDFKKSKDLAHAIAGATSTIGAMQVSEMAHEISQLSDEPEDLLKRLEGMGKALKASKAEFDRHFNHHGGAGNKTVH